jgi:hypothetical protein
MSTGIVIFAQNNSEVDYIKLAVFSARQAQKYLDVPVSIITDSRSWLETSQPDHPFDKIIDVDYIPVAQRRRFNDGSLSGKDLEWRNYARNQAYDLSPYYRTLVIDSDYIINSSVLSSAFTVDCNLQLYSSSFDLASWRSTYEFERINPYSIPFYWATAFVFEKTPIMKSFFDIVAYIKTNWDYFRVLYNIDTTLYRNDYAFSIAIHIMNGKTSGEFSTELPGKMVYTKDKDILVSMDQNKMQFLLEKKDYPGEYIAAKTQGLDIHVMNKFSLSRFIDGGSGV